MNKDLRLKLACYSMSISMALVCNLPPILFLTFRSMYGISYSLLGSLVLINFASQLLVDLVFSFFSHKFNIPLTIKIMPWLAFIGFLLYAAAPVLFPNQPFIGLLIGTVVFSVGSGLAEVLVSPIIASIPTENPDRAMSALHSGFAWGVVGVVVVATLFLKFFSGDAWQWLIVSLSIVPLTSALLFLGVKIPDLKENEGGSDILSCIKNPMLWIFAVAIFFAGALELTMSQWASSYLEQVLGIPKVWGDVCGVAMFGATLGLGRTLYSAYGKKLERVIFIGILGVTICYFAATVTDIKVIGLFACAFTGFFVSMAWPGTLVIASDKFPNGGVFLFAIMASAGDFGAAVAPQLFGIIADKLTENMDLIMLAERFSKTPEELGMRLGLGLGFAMSLVAIPVFFFIMKNKKKAR